MLDENVSPDRLDFYRQQAEHALRQAATAPDPVIRSGLLNLAAAWHRLIRETEAMTPPPPAGEQPAQAPRHKT